MRAARAGFTLFELMIVVAIIGILAAAAMPSLVRYRDNQLLRSVVRESAGMFATARSRALATNRNQIVLFNVGSATDVCGNAIVDPATGQPVPVLIIDDGAGAGAGNCCIDNGEFVAALTTRVTAAVTWGAAIAGVPPVSDTGGGASWKTVGTSFRQPAGTAARGVLFRPDGVPVTFSNSCALGGTGTGGGALYVTNNNRDYAVVLSPIGAVSLEAWDPNRAAWRN